jgi:hypothetical protein
MRAWRLHDYRPQPGLNPVQDWYDGQDGAVRGEFDIALMTFAALDDWTAAVEVGALSGKYLGLHEISVDVLLPNDSELYFRVIGAWLPDSCDFVLFLVSEKRGSEYHPPLDKALEYKNIWEQKKGEIYEHEFV